MLRCDALLQLDEAEALGLLLRPWLRGLRLFTTRFHRTLLSDDHQGARTHIERSAPAGPTGMRSTPRRVFPRAALLDRNQSTVTLAAAAEALLRGDAFLQLD